MPASEVARLIARHGHEVVRVVDRDDGVEALFPSPLDLVVAAGGDGTVALVAREMPGHDVPLTVLPLGTANNIALSLGCSGPLDLLIEHWAAARVRHADLGVARGPWGERRFIEGVGGGLVARAIAAIDAQPLDASHPPVERLELAIGGFLNVMNRLRPAPWTLRIDGERFDEDCLLVEILNIKSIGPNFVVSPAADPFDGSLTVAIATDAHREQLDPAAAGLPAGRLSTVRATPRGAGPPRRTDRDRAWRAVPDRASACRADSGRRHRPGR